MNKIRLILDVDGCMLDSLGAMSNYYNKLNGTDICPTQIVSWNAKEVFTTFTNSDMEYMFGTSLFWNYAKPYPNIIDTIKKIYDTEKFDISFCSIGSSENIIHKTIWLKTHFPFIDKQILLVRNKSLFMDKSEVNMQNAIFLDDSQSNLFTSNAKFKILCKFDGDKEWNSLWHTDESVVTNPDELYQELMSVWELENRL